MKLLFDENLSPRLPTLLAHAFPESMHVRDIGLQSAPDRQTWEHAKSIGAAIISKDDDFHQLSFTLGHPPKVIGLLVGNCSTRQIHDLLMANHEIIERFLADEAAAYLALP